MTPALHQAMLCLPTTAYYSVSGNEACSQQSLALHSLGAVQRVVGRDMQRMELTVPTVMHGSISYHWNRLPGLRICCRAVSNP